MIAFCSELSGATFLTLEQFQNLDCSLRMSVSYVSRNDKRILRPIIAVGTGETHRLSAMISDVSDNVTLLGETVKASRALESFCSAGMFVVHRIASVYRRSGRRAVCCT